MAKSLQRFNYWLFGHYTIESQLRFSRVQSYVCHNRGFPTGWTFWQRNRWSLINSNLCFPTFPRMLHLHPPISTITHPTPAFSRMGASLPPPTKWTTHSFPPLSSPSSHFMQWWALASGLFFNTDGPETSQGPHQIQIQINSREEILPLFFYFFYLNPWRGFFPFLFHRNQKKKTEL